MRRINKGFTLVELIVALTIISITFAAIIPPLYKAAILLQKEEEKYNAISAADSISEIISNENFIEKYQELKASNQNILRINFEKYEQLFKMLEDNIIDLSLKGNYYCTVEIQKADKRINDILSINTYDRLWEIRIKIKKREESLAAISSLILT